MCQMLVVRPGATALDEQERMKGSLDIPLSEVGKQQVLKTVDQIAQFPISVIYCGPCESAIDTAKILAEKANCKWKVCQWLKNLHHGLWEGKCIEEIKRQQPKLYRQVQENPNLFNPPEGESLIQAQQRVGRQLQKLQKKHASEVIAVVIPEPLATLIATQLKSSTIGDFWKSECDTGSWELIDPSSPSIKIMA
ncbi:MAG: histidine phosphatase family protein [Planctomycetota bacterium]|jgi:broad specificity phosphatase PhoE|nr:histidine phosphatase family protein [Planctomycetaceae bacterium]